MTPPNEKAALRNATYGARSFEANNPGLAGKTPQTRLNTHVGCAEATR